VPQNEQAKKNEAIPHLHPHGKKIRHRDGMTHSGRWNYAQSEGKHHHHHVKQLDCI
jgi:hypothetical protein